MEGELGPCPSSLLIIIIIIIIIIMLSPSSLQNLLSEAAAARRTKLEDSTIIFLGDSSVSARNLGHMALRRRRPFGGLSLCLSTHLPMPYIEQAGKSSLVAQFCSALQDNDDDTGDDILQEVSMYVKTFTSSLFSFFSSLIPSSIPTTQNQGRPLLSYSFFDAVDPADYDANSSCNDEDEAAARVNIWSLSDDSFKVGR